MRMALVRSWWHVTALVLCLQATFRPLATLMLVAYVVGIPSLLCWRLYGYKDVLHMPLPQFELGFLMRDYEARHRGIYCTVLSDGGLVAVASSRLRFSM